MMTCMQAPAPGNDASAPMAPGTIDVLLAWQALEVASKNFRGTFAAMANVSPSDFQAMVFLSGRDNTSSKDLGALLHLTTGAMTSLIDRLENAGQLSRQPHPTDRRSIRLVLTPAGQAAVTAAGAVYAGVVEQVIPAAEREKVVETLRGLAEALGAEAPTAP
jgi:DNA-binding MarR family transcriptional regulator